MMFPDGVYSFKNGRSKFHFTTPPSNRELDKLLTSLVQRVVRFLERRGLIQRDEDQAFLSLNSAPSAMDQVQSSSITYRIALGKNKGQKGFWNGHRDLLGMWWKVKSHFFHRGA